MLYFWGDQMQESEFLNPNSYFDNVLSTSCINSLTVNSVLHSQLEQTTDLKRCRWPDTG